MSTICFTSLINGLQNMIHYLPKVLVSEPETTLRSRHVARHLLSCLKSSVKIRVFGVIARCSQHLWLEREVSRPQGELFCPAMIRQAWPSGEGVRRKRASDSKLNASAGCEGAGKGVMEVRLVRKFGLGDR